MIVVESLPEGDYRSGTELFEQTLAPAAVQDGSLVVELRVVNNRREFLKVLREVARIAERYGSSPILHLETHGSRTGIQLADGASLPWSDISGPLREINRRSNMNLLVFAGLCHGWSMMDVLRPTDRAPMFGMIGPMQNVEAGELLAATNVLYEELLSHGNHDLRSALDSANGTANIEDWKFRWLSAELMFCRAFDQYMRQTSGESSTRERANRLVAEIARVRGLTVEEAEQLRPSVEADLENHEHWFQHCRRYFLWLDIFPGNEGRFTLEFEDCIDRE